MWERAEEALIDALNAAGRPWEVGALSQHRMRALRWGRHVPCLGAWE